MNHQQPHSDADNNVRWANACYWLAWLGLVLALVYIVASYGQKPRNYEILHNSDTAFIPLFYRDLLARGTIDGWDLPTNPYLVPDMALFIPLDLLLNNINLSVILYGVIQLLLTVVGLLLLQRQLFGAARLPQTLMLLTMTLCILFLATWNHLFTYLPLMTSHHFGVLVMLPFATVALLRALQPTRSAQQQRRATLVLFVLTLLMALSDSLFIIQFVLPALFALLLWGKSKDTTWRQLLLLGGVLLLAAAAGQWLRQWLVPVSKLLIYTDLEDQTIISESIERLGEWSVEVATRDPLFALFWLSSLLALFAATVIALVRLKKWVGARPLVLVATLLLASLPISVAAAIATGNVDGDSSARYILPTLFLPLFCGWPFLLALWTTGSESQSTMSVQPRSWVTRWVIVASGIVAILFIGYMLVTVQPAALAAVPGYQDPFVACLERETAQRNLRYGLAEFWQAHYTSALSQGQLHIATATSTLSPYLWNANRYHYQDPFEFVVINSTAPSVWRIRKEFLVERFGPPLEVFECEGNPVYVYDPATNVQLQEWFEHHSDLVTLQEVGDEIELYGYTLPSPIGGVSIGLSQGASEEWDQEPGMLAYVPLRGIPAGSYAVAIDLFTDNADSGEWEVISLTSNDAQMIVREPITATGQSTIRGHFDLKEEADVDLGVKYDGNGLLYVDKIRIARVDPTEAATYEFASAPAPADATAPARLTLISPYAESTIDQPQVDFVWQWTGEPLPKEQTFEVRLWKKGEAIHYGAHDAMLGRELIRQIGNTYTLRLDPAGAYSVIKNGAGEYEWTVAIVAVEPTYQEMHIEAAPYPLHVQR